MKPAFSILLVLASPLLAIAQSNSPSPEFEAESGIIRSPFTVTNNCLCQLVQTGLTNGGWAEYEFTVSSDGDYSIKALVKTKQGVTNAFLVEIYSGETGTKGVWDVPETAGFEWKTAEIAGEPTPGLNGGPKRRVFELKSGEHHLIVRGIAPNVMVDRWRICRTLASASDLGVIPN